MRRLTISGNKSNLIVKKSHKFQSENNEHGYCCSIEDEWFNSNKQHMLTNKHTWHIVDVIGLLIVCNTWHTFKI